MQSDLILDVVRNAQPEKSRVVRDKLGSISQTSLEPPQIGEFQKVITDLASRAISSQSSKRSEAAIDSQSPAALVPLSLHTSNAATWSINDLPTRTPPAQTKDNGAAALEEYVLKNFVEAILPKNSEMLFGAGTAGRMWRSMLADHVAKQISESVDLALLPEPAPGQKKWHTQVILKE